MKRSLRIAVDLIRAIYEKRKLTPDEVSKEPLRMKCDVGGRYTHYIRDYVEMIEDA